MMRSLLPVFSMVALSGCPSSTTQVKPDVPAAPSLAPGKYAHEGCVTHENADGTTSWVQTTYEITATGWKSDTIVYGDEQCATKNATVHTEGTIGALAPSATITGALDATMNVTMRMLTPHVPGYIALMQSYSCGKAPYAVNEAQDILTGGCKDLGFHPLSSCGADHDVVKIEADGALIFGKRPADNDLCTAEKRPKELSSVRFVRAAT